MGRGKKWSSKESERVAIAWCRATHDPVVVAISQVTHLMRKFIRCFLRNLRKMQILVLTMIVATPL